MRKRRYPWVVGALLIMVVASACNGDTTAPETDDGATPGEETPQIETVEEGVLTVGSDIPYPPFEFREGGEVVGFDMDLIREIATRIGFEDVNIVDTDFDTIFTQLAAGRFDVVASATTITEEREQEVNFSEGYYNAQQSLAVQQGSDIASTDDLGEGNIVGVQRGTTGQLWAQENLEPQGVELRTFVQTPDMYLSLEAGQVDGVINDEPSAIQEIEERDGLELVEVIDTGEIYGIAVDPNNEPLLDAVNQALQEMIDDGTYEEIYNQYPDLPPGGNVAAS